LRSIPFVLAAAAALLLPAPPTRGGDAAPADISRIARVEPTILVPRLTYELEQGIVAQLDLKNPSILPVEVPAACLSMEALRLARLGVETPLKGSGRIGDGKGFVLAPGGDMKIDLVVSRMYRLKELGRYRLSWACGEFHTPHYDFFVTTSYDREKDRIAVLTTDLGTLELVLMPEQAPEHVRNFVELARAGYYDGVMFYRVLRGVEADTGDPTGTGTGGWDHQLAPEIDPGIRPGKGLVGALRRESSMTSATNFFILLDVQPGFQGLHTFFAYVRGGMEVLDALSGVEISGQSGLSAFRPVNPVAIRKIEIKAP
jgi:cyclophilin family peptidyl-prolyl cis-trans isomerase